ncbi:hypothetical protein BD289DRAFT_447603 [Coniella lustricola]|uniref:Uncharacterized protein n=1 Tax=Coniella lustricola TaxID=2025994 RepID=A0A2T2ZSW9_9PEZI|nr:hypothetical protein BD289DRAFT_447603 [Coniella lustricola]
MKTATTASLLAALLATTATAAPGLFDDIHSDFDEAKTKVEDVWSSATASSTTTTTSSSSTTTSSTATATATAYPGCTSSSSNNWCGVAVSFQTNTSAAATANTTIAPPSSFNITITDSKCNQVATKTGVQPNMGVSFDSSVGNWEFGVYSTTGRGLSLTYEGRNVSDYKSWQNFGFEYLNYTEGNVMLYGVITNCTSASNEKSTSSSSSSSSSSSNNEKDNDSSNGAVALAVSTGWLLAAVGLGMAALL